MNKTQQKIANYAKAINDLIETTEKNQDEMNPLFESLKEAMKDNKVAEMNTDEYWKIQETFTKGTENYREALATIKVAQAPAKLMGVHHSLLKSYQEFVDGCQAMVDSLHDDRTIDEAAFKAAEANQDAATDQISRHLSRISSLV